MALPLNISRLYYEGSVGVTLVAVPCRVCTVRLISIVRSSFWPISGTGILPGTLATTNHAFVRSGWYTSNHFVVPAIASHCVIVSSVTLTVMLHSPDYVIARLFILASASLQCSPAYLFTTSSADVLTDVGDSWEDYILTYLNVRFTSYALRMNVFLSTSFSL